MCHVPTEVLRILKEQAKSLKPGTLNIALSQAAINSLKAENASLKEASVA